MIVSERGEEAGEKNSSAALSKAEVAKGQTEKELRGHKEDRGNNRHLAGAGVDRAGKLKASDKPLG